jgi:hypothetical protein
VSIPRKNFVQFHIQSLLFSLFMLPSIANAATVHVPEDYETVHQALGSLSSNDTVVVREYYYRERIPHFDDMPTVICAGWEPEFIDVEPRVPKESRNEVCGDANGDGLCSVSDIVFLSEYFYSGGPAPEPGGDADNDGSITPQDIAYLVGYFYFSGPPPCYYGWQGQMQVNQPDDLFDSTPFLTFQNDSIPWIVWDGHSASLIRESVLEVYASKWNGEIWSDEMRVNAPNDSCDNWRISAAFGEEDLGISTWHQIPLGSYVGEIFYGTWDGEAWQEQGMVNNPDELHDGAPYIAYGGGEFWVSWVDYRYSGLTDIYASHFNGSGWDPEMAVSDTSNDSVGNAYHQIAVDRFGTPHLTWSITGGIIVYSTYDGNSWSEPFVVSVRDSGEFDLDSDITVDDSGNIHIVWAGHHLGERYDYDIYYRSYNGVIWSDIVQINEEDSRGDYRPSIAASAPVNVWVTWDGVDGTGEYHIYAVHYDGTQWSAEQRIDSDGTNFDSGTEVCLSSRGYPWVTWCGSYDYPDSHLEIFCNYYRTPARVSAIGRGKETSLKGSNPYAKTYRY